MSAKRTRSQANLDKKDNAPKQTKLPWSRQSSSPSASEDDEEASRPAKKRKAQKSKTQKSKTQKPAAKKDPTPAKLYKDTLKEVDVVFNALMKRYKPNMSGVTADSFANSMEKFMPKVTKLAETSPVHAFNFVLDLGEHAYGDLEASMKASGYGDTTGVYQKLDEQLVALISARVALDKDAGVVPAGEYVVRPPHEEVGVEERELRRENGQRWKKRRPNKQDWARLDRARREDLKALFEIRRERRETAEDWAGNALNDLLETGGRIDQYGIGKHYFRKSIDLLAEIKGVERPPLPKPPRE